MIWITIWYVGGVIGALMLWNVDRSMNVRIFTNRQFSNCPTPIAIVGMLAAGICGPLTFAGGVIWSILEGAAYLRHRLKINLSWWVKPVCDRRE